MWTPSPELPSVNHPEGDSAWTPGIMVSHERKSLSQHLWCKADGENCWRRHLSLCGSTFPPKWNMLLSFLRFNWSFLPKNRASCWTQINSVKSINTAWHKKCLEFDLRCEEPLLWMMLANWNIAECHVSPHTRNHRTLISLLLLCDTVCRCLNNHNKKSLLQSS